MDAVRYTLIRSKRKTMVLQVTKELAVVVRAPRYTPKAEIDRFAAAHADWIAKQMARYAERARAYPEPGEEEWQRLIERARAYIPARVAVFAKEMGVTPNAVKITRAKTRFGSCSAKNSLCFSCLLMRYPQEAVDYVVVHELAHITQKNHSKAFYALIEAVLPDYRLHRALLKS